MFEVLGQRPQSIRVRKLSKRVKGPHSRYPSLMSVLLCILIPLGLKGPPEAHLWSRLTPLPSFQALDSLAKILSKIWQVS